MAAHWRRQWGQRGGSAASAVAAARWPEWLQVAAAAWRWQCVVGGGGSAAAAAAARWQHGGSTAAAARRWRRQPVAEAAVGDGQDEGGEVVTWRLFIFVIFLHICSVPVNHAKGSHL